MKWFKKLFTDRTPRYCHPDPEDWDRVPANWCLADGYSAWGRNHTNANKYLIASFLPTRNGRESEVFAVAFCPPEQEFWQWATTKDSRGLTTTMLFDSVDAAKEWIGCDAKAEIARRVSPFAVSEVFCPNRDLIP